MNNPDSIEGASNNERLLAAARADNEELLLEIFDEGGFDINCQDGLGNTPLHIAASNSSLEILEHILGHEDCDVDPINRIERATPLHLAVKIEDADARRATVESLLDAGADISIKDRNGETALSLVPENDPETRALFRRAQAQTSISADDIASDDDDEPGSNSGSEE